MTRHVVDSSAWLAYFADGPSAEHFAPIIEKPEALLVPTITLFEVFKRIAAQRDENDAIACVAVMQQGEVVPSTQREPCKPPSSASSIDSPWPTA